VPRAYKPVISSEHLCDRYTNTAGIEELNDRFKVPIESKVGTHA
jgi:hypothetical protein